jgi:RHS repeat-associated protein
MLNTVYKNIVLFLLLYIVPGMVMAQAIMGPSCVVPGISYQYTLSNGGTKIKSWCVTNGVIKPNNTTCIGTTSNTITVVFNGGESPIISVTATTGSSELDVSIAGALQPGSINSGSLSQTINYNTAPQQLLCAPASGGCAGNYGYSWQFSYDQVAWHSAGVFTQNYSPGNLTQTTYFRRLDTDPGSGQNGYTGTAVVQVYPELIAGTVNPGNQTINYNGNGQQLSINGVAGGNGVYAYEWQQSLDGSNWTSTNVTGTVFTVAGVTAKTYYRVAVTSNGVTAYSSMALVDVYPPLTVGFIDPNGQQVLVNAVPQPLTISGISGGNGSYTYQWEVSSDNISFTPIGQANSATYSPTPASLPSYNYYRLAVTSNGITVYSSNSAAIEVKPHLTAGAISGSSGPVSYYGSPGVIKGTYPTGGICLSYAIQWQISTDGSTFEDVPNVYGLDYTPVNLTQNIVIRNKVSCGTETAYSNAISVTVNPALNPGSISITSLMVDAGTLPGQLNALPASGGNCASYSYQWEISYDNVSFSPIAGATGQNYTPDPFDKIRYFRRMVTCGADVAYTPVCSIDIGGIITSSNVNYIRERDVYKPGVTDKATADGLIDKNDVNQVTQYFEGLGNLIQTVNKQASPSGQDLVIPNTYDGAGREAVKYLPYVSAFADGEYQSGAYNAQQAFNANKFQGENFYYSQVQYEASPLNRPVASYAPGKNWIGATRGIQVKYWLNTPTDDVKIWRVTNGTGSDKWGSYSISTVYGPGELFKNASVNEEGKQVIEFKDKKGLIVLKKVQLTAAADDGNGSGYNGWLCTYYIYDDFGQLRAVIQPKGVDLLYKNLTWDITALNGDILNEQCFRYEYDERRRMIRKKVPGAGDVSLIYDVRDRLVFTQDANQHQKNEWFTTLYDNLNRPVITGLMSWAGEAAVLQQNVTSQATNGATTGLPTDRTLFLPNTSGTVQATNSITMTDGFSTDPNADFIAEIVQGNSGQISTVEEMTVSLNPLQDGAGFTLLTKTGYDDYDAIPAASGFDKNIDNNYTGTTYLNTNYTSFPYAEEVSQSFQTQDLVTWTQKKILGTTNQYLYSVSLYDEKGRLIQTKSRNKTNGVDITTMQYSFNNQPLVKVVKQEKAGPDNPQTHIVVSKMQYDHRGRLLSIRKSVNSNINGSIITKPEFELVANEYDELGQLNMKKLGKKIDQNGNYTTEAMQELKYDYNIRGWLLGINREYLTTEGQTSDGKLFGFELGYDNTANKAGQAFKKAAYNGNIAGMLWKSDGDDIRRIYDFGYDAANRLMLADFTQQNAEDHQWNHNKVDFTVKMGDGSLLSNGDLDPTKAYDANGNILQMQQWGLKMGSSSPIDDLHYSYYNNEVSNKLKEVSDNAVGGTGDFTDNNSGSNDYGYDVNGNMLIDLNKGIGTTAVPDVNMTAGGAITYNNLNLPEHVSVKDGNNDKGTIQYVYDAIGTKLQKIVTEKNVTVTLDNNSYTGDVTTTITYLGGMVYESKSYQSPELASLNYTDKLQFIEHEEGRIRFEKATTNTCPVEPDRLVYDYFIKDHLGNTRMVLTEQQNNICYRPATLEDVAITDEKKLYSINDDQVTDISQVNGAANYSQFQQKLYQLNGGVPGQRTGLGIVLKVMSGDKVRFAIESIYNMPGGGSPGQPATAALTELLAAMAGNSLAIGKGVDLPTITNLQTGTDIGNFLVQHDEQPTRPKAYLNYILFDEQFKYVKGDVDPVRENGGYKLHDKFINAPVNVTKNGYLYIYASNESNMQVFFDNLLVTHIPGPLLEETHYYPFGLTMTGISSKAANSIENRYKFNGIEQNNDFDLNMYDANFRNLDPQLGRFWQIDPKFESAEMSSPYSAMSNNPILFSDPLGDVIRNAHDEEVNLAAQSRDAADAALNVSMGNYGVADRGISKKDFLAAGHTKDDWKDFKSVRNQADRAESRLNTALVNQFDAQEDINQLQHDNPTLFNAVNDLPVDVYIGRTDNSSIVDNGGGANAINVDGAGNVHGRMYNLDDLIAGDAPQWRPGVAIWTQNGKTQAGTVRHEVGHTLAMFGGVPALGIVGIQYGGFGNPANMADFIRHFAAGGNCADCRENNNCTPTQSAAVAAERLRLEAANRYIRRVNPHR